jgi:hypothetical protein
VKTSFVSAAFGAVFVLSSHAVHAELAYGMTSQFNVEGERLIRFDTASPSTFVDIGAFSGLASGRSLRSIDFRPADGRLYAFGVDPQGSYGMYTVNLQTAQLSLVGEGTVPNFAWPLRVSMDIDPVTDTVRIVTGGQSRNNFRFSPVTGALIAEDGAVAYAVGDSNFGFNPIIQGIAYSRLTNGTTTLYGSDFNTGFLTRIGGVNGTPSPDTGAMNANGRHVTISLLNDSAGTGFDISHATGVAFMSHDIFNNPTAGWDLSRIDLNTGRATRIGSFGANVLDMSVVIPSPSAMVLLGLGAGIAIRRRR